MSILSSTTSGGKSFPITEELLKEYDFEYDLSSTGNVHERNVLSHIDERFPGSYVKSYTSMIYKHNDWLGIVKVTIFDDGNYKDLYFAYFQPNFLNITLYPTDLKLNETYFNHLVQEWFENIEKKSFEAKKIDSWIDIINVIKESNKLRKQICDNKPKVIGWGSNSNPQEYVEDIIYKPQSNVMSL